MGIPLILFDTWDWVCVVKIWHYRLKCASFPLLCQSRICIWYKQQCRILFMGYHTLSDNKVQKLSLGRYLFSNGTLIYFVCSTIRGDLRIQGALNSVARRGIDETHLSMFHSISNCARGKRSRISIYSAARYMLSTFSFFLSRALVKRLYHIHVTWFNWFLRREGDSAPH